MSGILFDARWIRPGMTGVGQVALNMLRAIPADAGNIGVILPEGSPFTGEFRRFRVHPSGVKLTAHPLTEAFEQVGIPLLCRKFGYTAFVSFEGRIPVFHPGFRTYSYVYDLSFLNIKGAHNRKYSFFLRASLWMNRIFANRIMTISEAMRNELVRKQGVSPARVSVVPCGDSRLDLVSARTFKGAGESFLLTVGATNPRKNLDRLLSAFRIFRTRHPAFKLVITGDRKRIAEAQARLSVEGVENVGYVSEGELRDLYERATALVFPSLDEGFGIPLLDACAFNLPVACSDIPVFREVMHESAIYFDPLSPEAMAAAMEHAVAAQPFDGSPVRARYSWHLSARKLLEIIREDAATADGTSAPLRPPSSITLNASMLPGDPGGIANYAFHIARALKAVGPALDVTLIHPAHLAGYFGELRGVRRVSLPGSQEARFVLNQLLVPWLARRSDLLHSVGNYGVFLRFAPQSVFIHDTYEKESKDRFGTAKRWLLSFLVSMTGRKARVILTNSENTRNDIARHYPHLAGKAKVTPLGTKFPIVPDSAERVRGGFLFVGTLEPGKRLSDILEAYAHLDGRMRAAHPLRIVGQKGWGESGLAAKVADLKIGDAVEFTGYVTDARLRELYLESLALIQASSYEGFGLPVVEAMACGCPVIAARNSALAEVGEGAAAFFPTGDVRALVELMERMIRDTDFARECSRKSLDRAAYYTWERTADATLAALRSLLGGAPRA